jgi:tRNA nucleotidyltransferase (CCA-adding enzyme)
MKMTVPFNLPIHPLAVEVCRILQATGYQAYIVGGCVRDLHLDTPPKDWDICTDATPEQVAQLFPRTLPTGLQHGTVTVCMEEGVENHFEVTTFRVEGKYLDGRRPEVVKFVSDLKEDLARRDFTINAMAYDPIAQVIMDPFDGKKDLQQEIIRAVGDANARFQEDGLRIMRAARFAARFNYYIDSDTLQGMSENISTLQKVSRERISDELRKTLMTENAHHGLSYLSMCHALPTICPQLMHYAGEAFFPLIGNYSGDLETRLAEMYSFTSSQIAQEELTSLRFSHKEIKRVVFLLDTLLGPPRNYKAFMVRLKNEAPDHWEYALQQYIKLTAAQGAPIQGWLDQHRDEIVLARKELAINGDDLMALGFPPGPQLKKLLDEAYQEILEHPERNNKNYLETCLVIRHPLI